MGNTSYSHEKGDHWVALVMNRNHCFYFDSFGLPVLSSEIFDFLKPYHKVFYSDVCIQNIDSLSCGKFCIAFIKNVKKKSLMNIFYLFSTKFISARMIK